VTIYTLNQKRQEIARIEEAYNLGISFEPMANMMGGSFELDRTSARAPMARPKAGAISVEAGFQERQPEIVEPEIIEEAEIEEDEETTEAAAPREHQAPRQPGHQQQQPAAQEGEGHGGRRRRRRRRRGGRGRGGHDGQPQSQQHGPQHGHHAQQQQRPQEPRAVEAEAQVDDGR
jgi:ribonuclease E